MSVVLRGTAVVNGALRPTRLRFGPLITAIEDDPAAPPDRLLLPGFVDTHVHGGGGGDTMDGPEGVRTLARLHARHGTTTLLPTTMTAPWPEVLRALRGVREVVRGGVPGGADVPGAHLEGPFISPHRLGAQPPHALGPTPERVREVLDTGVLRAVTLAPECPGALDAAVRFARAGVRVGVGHTAGTFEATWALLEAVGGAGGQAAGTHTFNAMGGLAGREPGPLGALLAHPAAALELIVDGHHLHPGAVRLALALGDRALLVTDAMRAAGLGDGPSELGGQAVTVEGGRARLDDGTLAGSVLTMDRAFRELVGLGLELPEASRRASEVPARSLGLRDRGRLAVGLRADVVVLDRATLEVTQVWVGGQPVGEGRDA